MVATIFLYLNIEKNYEFLLNWEKKINIWINFIIDNKENHALITNHLSSTLASLIRWIFLFPNSENIELAKLKALEILEIIIRNQDNREGWYKEYDGPDPGYQTLANSYLADVFIVISKFQKSKFKDRILNYLNLSIKRNLKFLKYFIYPDGSFGGQCGSRSTRIYYPGGIELLSNYFSDALLITKNMSKNIIDGKTISLRAVDFGNLSPLLIAIAKHLLIGNLLKIIKNTKLPT